MSGDSLDDKISIARTRLLLDRPFLGALTLRLPLVEAAGSWCPTTATDMRSIFFNRNYLDALGIRQIEFILAHEALHCGLSHFARRGHRDKRRWDLACDLAINPLLIEEGLTPPSNAVTFFEYAGLSAEEIYPLLQENDDRQAMDQHLDGSAAPSEHHADARPPPVLSAEREALVEQWRQHLVAAAQRAAMSGRLSGTLARWVNALLQPRLPWRALLAQYLRSFAREDFSYMRPARRESEAILPGLRSHAIRIAVAVDVSGSISDTDLRDFLSEVSALKGQVNAAVTLLPCDRELHGVPEVFEAWDELRAPVVVPRGGNTDFRPVFEWLDRQDVMPDMLVYFTDARGKFPAAAPDCPVCWVVKGPAGVPWGTRIQLN